MDLDIVRIECEIITERVAQVTAPLHEELRKFETYFKTSCCRTPHKTCSSWAEHDESPYKIIFSQNLSSDPEVVRLHQKPPLPFALTVSSDERGLTTTSLSVGLVVIGSAVNFVEHFYAALLLLVETVVHSALGPDQYSYHSYMLDYQGVKHEILHGTTCSDRIILLSGQQILHNAVQSDSIRISLKSPLRLLCNGSVIHLFDFAAFFRSQMRRCSSLCAYYGSGELHLDFAQLSDRVQDVAVFDDQMRYIQPRWSKLKNRAGLSGSAEFSGLVEPMAALLQLGSYFNAGKGATFGAGQYEIEVM